MKVFDGGLYEPKWGVGWVRVGPVTVSLSRTRNGLDHDLGPVFMVQVGPVELRIGPR